MNNQIPEPHELKGRFLIPREYIKLMAVWMGLSESMVYQLLRKGKPISKRTMLTLERRCGIPVDTWNSMTIDLDILNEDLYTYWYKHATSITSNPTTSSLF